MRIIPFPLFIPTTAREMQSLGWRQLDVILVSGDAYIDSPHIGVAVIGKALMNAGFRALSPSPTFTATWISEGWGNLRFSGELPPVASTP